MDQFDKKIRKTLAKAPRHEPDSEVWGKIAPHLTPSGGGTAVSWARPARMTVALLTVAGLFYWLGTQRANTRNLEVELEKLSQEMAELQKGKGARESIVDTVVIRDTIWHIYHPDGPLAQGLFKDRVDGRVLDPVHSNDFNANYRPEILQTPPSVVNDSKQILDNNYLRLLSGRKLFTSNDNSGTEKEKTSADQSEVIIDQYDLLKLRAPLLSTTYKRNIRLHPYQGLLADQIIKSEKSKRFWESIIPDHFRLGLVGGSLNLALHDIEHSQEWLGGIQAEFLFSQRVSILTGLRYRYFKSKNEGEFESNSFPIPADLQPGDRLKELYTTIRYLNIPLLFKYSYPLSKKFYPYIHSGILIGGAQKQKYKYEIKRNDENLDLYTEVNRASWTINSYLLGLGLEFNPTARVTLTVDAEGRYHFKVPASEYIKNNGIGMRLGLYYNL